MYEYTSGLRVNVSCAVCEENVIKLVDNLTRYKAITDDFIFRHVLCSGQEVDIVTGTYLWL